ncbi:MAG: tetratricopeptide repeat protein [Betaproteobacteria bacterium]|nr:tetratricopeptide repeat protein [Betaproteobacteria bacterium]
MQSKIADLESAFRHREAGRYKESARIFESWLEDNPKDANVRALLAHVLSLDKQEEEAWHELKMAISLDSSSPEVKRNLARLLLRRGNSKEALHAAQAAYQTNSSYPENQLILAAALASNQRTEEAFLLVENTLIGYPAYAEAYVLRAQLRLLDKDFSGALSDAEIAVTLKPHLGQAWELAGSLRQRFGKLHGAIRAFEAALDCEPDHTSYLASLGELRRQAGELEAAIVLLEMAANFAPSDATVWANLGAALHLSKRMVEAKAAYTRSMKANPDQAEAASNLGGLFKDEGEYGEALFYINRALTIKPDFPEAHNNRGYSLIKLQRFSEALAAFETASRLSDDVRTKLANTKVESTYQTAREGTLIIYQAQGDIERFQKEFRNLIMRIGCETDSEFDRYYVEGLAKSGTIPIPLIRRDRFRYLIKLFSRTMNLPGLVAECGCYRGLSSYLLCQRIRLDVAEFDGNGYQIFDSFQGLSCIAREDTTSVNSFEDERRPPQGVIQRGRFSASLKTVKQSLIEFPRIEYFPGWIPTAFPQTHDNQYRFVHVDVDLYQPTKDSFDYFWPRLTLGGMIVCDDYNWPGGKRAVEEFCQSVGVSFEVTPYGQAYFLRLE